MREIKFRAWGGGKMESEVTEEIEIIGNIHTNEL